MLHFRAQSTPHLVPDTAHWGQASCATCCTSSWAHGSEPGVTCGFVCLLAESTKHGQATAASQARAQARPQHTAASTLLVLGICSQSGLLALPLSSNCSCLPLLSLLNGCPNCPFLLWFTAEERISLVFAADSTAGSIALLGLEQQPDMPCIQQ